MLPPGCELLSYEILGCLRTTLFVRDSKSTCYRARAEIVRRALNVDNGEAERLRIDLQILEDYQESCEATMKDMTLEEKTELDIQLAEETARTALGMVRNYYKVFDPAIKGYRLIRIGI